MEHAMRRGTVIAGLVLSLVVAGCSAVDSSPSSEVAGPSPSDDPVAAVSTHPSPAPTPVPTPAPTTEPSPTDADSVPARDTEPDPDDDENAEPGTGACAVPIPMPDGSVIDICQVAESATTVQRHTQDGGSVPGWPVVLDGALVGNTWNDFTIGCGRPAPDAVAGLSDSVFVAVQTDGAAMLHRLAPDGHEMAGWPQRLPGDIAQPDGMGSAGCFGYLVAPDDRHVVGWGYEGGGPDMELNADRTVFTLWTADGELVPGWPRGSTGAASGPVLFDDYVTYVSGSGRVWRHGPDGDVLDGWGYRLATRSAPIIGTQGQVGVLQPSFEEADRIVVIGADGRPADGYPVRLPGGIETECLYGDTPCAGDVQPAFLMNGTVYVALGNGGEHEVGETGSKGGSIVAFDERGRPVDGWPVQLPDRTHATWMGVDTTGSLIVEAVTCGPTCGESSTPVTLLYDMEGQPTVPDGG